MAARISIICIWVCFITLLVLGIVMVASTGTGASDSEMAIDAMAKQGKFALGGIAVALFLSKIDYHVFRNKWLLYILWGTCVALLIMCYLPVIGKEVNGEHRWINLRVFTLQPSELAKCTLMIALANWYATHREMAGTFIKGFVTPGIIFGIPLVLILFEKDMGTAAALAVAGFCVMFVAGARCWVLLLSIIMASMVLFDQATGSHNRMERIYAWNNPEAHAGGAGRQQWIAHLAMQDGGTTGVGLGNSIYKYGSLPYAHTDFIYAIVGEEWGFIGSAGVLFLFSALTLAGSVMALQLKDTFGRLLAVGIVCTIFWPALLNMMVVTAILPNTGLPLPFISYGGTNLICTIAAIGILTSIQRYTPIIQENLLPNNRNRIKR